MEGASHFAVGLLIFWFAAIAFFFAFHPGGVADIGNPVDAIKWMITQFQQTQASSPATGSDINSGPAQADTGMSGTTANTATGGD